MGNRDFHTDKKKRVYVRVADLRIAPDTIAAYTPIKNKFNPDEIGITIAFANGRYIDLLTTKEEQERFLKYMDKLKTPERI